MRLYIIISIILSEMSISGFVAILAYPVLMIVRIIWGHCMWAHRGAVDSATFAVERKHACHIL